MELLSLAGNLNEGGNWTLAETTWTGSAGDKGSPGSVVFTGRSRKTAWDPITDVLHDTNTATLKVRLQSEGAAT